jgi:predicted permease
MHAMFNLSVFMTVLEATLLLLGVGLLGFYLAARKVVPEVALGALLPLVLDVALPGMVFTDIFKRFSPQARPGWVLLPLWWFLFTAGSWILSTLISRIVRSDLRKEFRLSLFYQNAVFFPLIILSQLYGSDSSHIVDHFLFNLFFSAFFFGTIPLFFRKPDSPGLGLQWRRIISPMLIATLLAVGLSLTGWKDAVPDLVLQITDLLGRMALPLILIVIGGSLYLDIKSASGKVYLKETVVFIGVKNLLYPGITLLAISHLQISSDVGILLLLQSAAPPLTSVPLMVQREGGNKNAASQFLTASFVFSAFTVPLFTGMYLSR